MNPDWAQALVLSTTEFEVGWELLRLGETPWQLDPPRSGFTVGERTAIVEDVIVNLQRRGLGTPCGPGPALTEHLRLLAHPEWSVDIRFRTDTLVAAVAACHGPRASLAVRHGQEIALLALHTDDAASVLLGLTGDAPMGAGHPVRLSARVFDEARRAAPRDHDRFTEHLVRLGSTPADVTTLVTMCRNVSMMGQLGATGSAHDGACTRRAPYVLGFHRNDAGQFRQIRRGDVVDVGPAGHHDLLAYLQELVGTVR